VKFRKAIIPFLAAFATVVFLAGSGDVTVVIHSCNMIKTTKVSTVSVLNPVAPASSCCKMSENENDSREISFSTNCCDYSNHHFRLPNYVGVQKQIIALITTELYFKDYIINFPAYIWYNLPAETFDKHGGRFMLNLNCQILS